MKLHNINRVVGLTHRNCGAAKLALGDSIMKSRKSETKAHGDWLKVFASSVRQRHPRLEVACGVIDFDGSIELISA